MIIDEIKAQKKNKDRFNLFSDGVFAGALDMETLAKHGIREGVEISEAALRVILAEDNEKYAFEKALNYISYTRRTEHEVRKFLHDREIGEDAAEKVVEKLKSYGYIDDAAYAEEYAATLIGQKNTSLKTAEYKLRQKGISQYVIEDALARWEESDLENAGKLYDALFKKYAKGGEAAGRQKIARALAARGFDYDTIQCVVNRKGE